MYNNAWYVGRVAEVHKNGERIDVNYIDGDVSVSLATGIDSFYLLLFSNGPHTM